MSNLGALIQAHIDGESYPPSQRALARKINISPTALGNWMTGELKRLPDADNLRSAARVLGVPYSHVLRAALLDTGYLEDEVMGNAQHPAPITRQAADPGSQRDTGLAVEEVSAADDSDLIQPDVAPAQPQPGGR